MSRTRAVVSIVKTDYVYVMYFDGEKIRHMTKVWHARLDVALSLAFERTAVAGFGCLRGAPRFARRAEVRRRLDIVQARADIARRCRRGRERGDYWLAADRLSKLVFGTVILRAQ